MTKQLLNSILEEVEAVNNDVEPTKMPGISQIRHETDEEDRIVSIQLSKTDVDEDHLFKGIVVFSESCSW